MAIKIEIVCEKCGSKNVRRDSDSVWNVETQQWESVALYDSSNCEDCGAEDCLKEIALQ
jgi:hypothetical protein